MNLRRLFSSKGNINRLLREALKRAADVHARANLCPGPDDNFPTLAGTVTRHSVLKNQSIAPGTEGADHRWLSIFIPG
jgi:hypothetical protein